MDVDLVQAFASVADDPSPEFAERLLTLVATVSSTRMRGATGEGARPADVVELVAEEPPSRRWPRVASLIGAAALVVVGAVIVRDHRQSTPAVPPTVLPTSAPTTTTPPPASAPATSAPAATTTSSAVAATTTTTQPAATEATTTTVPGDGDLAPVGTIEPLRITAGGWTRTADPARHFVSPVTTALREEIFRQRGGLGDPGLLVRTTTGGCALTTDPDVLTLGSWISVRHCAGDVTVELLGDRIPRATVEQVMRSIDVNADGDVVSLGSGGSGFHSAGSRRGSVYDSWMSTYRSASAYGEAWEGPIVDVRFGSQVEPSWSLTLDMMFFSEPRGQQVVDVSDHRAVVLDSDTATEVVSWFESPYLLVTVSGVMTREHLLAVARSVQVVAGSDPRFAWPGGGPDGYVPPHLPDPTTYGPGGYALTRDRKALCRYIEFGAKGGGTPSCVALEAGRALYLPGFFGQPLLVVVPANAARLVDTATGAAVAVRDTKLVGSTGQRIWEVPGDAENPPRSYEVLDRAGAVLGCASGVLLTC